MKGNATTPQVAERFAKLFCVKVKPVYLNRVTARFFYSFFAVNNLRHFTFYCSVSCFMAFRILNCLIYVTCNNQFVKHNIQLITLQIITTGKARDGLLCPGDDS